MIEEKLQRDSEKKNVFNHLIGIRHSVFVHFQPSIENDKAMLPVKLMSKDQVVLQFGRFMAIPITDMVVTDEGVSATLSFSGKSELCVIPWRCVFAVVGDDAKGMVWKEDAPSLHRKMLEEQAGPHAPVGVLKKNKAAARAGWAVIDGGAGPLREKQVKSDIG